MNLLDVGLLATAAAFAASGWRQGFVVGVLGFAGFIGGGVAAMILTPKVVSQWHAGPTLLVTAATAVVLAASLGQWLMTTLGRFVRRRLTWRAVRTVDSGLGAIVSVCAVLVIVWFVALALRAAPVAPVSRAVRTSAVIRAVNAVMPSGSRTLFASFRGLLDEGSFPQVFGGLAPERILPVAVPDPAVAQSDRVVAARSSIVEVSGAARSCSRQVDGTGFVYAPEHVLTNAHVVAGVSSPFVRVGGTGRSLNARVVAFDRRRDVAVLFVPGLVAPTLPLVASATRGDAAVVAGFPHGGPYRRSAARVREVIRARGPDIYGEGETTREVLSLYATVQPGNSGGPLLSPRAGVIGVVFAKSIDDPTTGYALSVAEVAPVADPARTLQRPVSTGGCTH